MHASPRVQSVLALPQKPLNNMHLSNVWFQAILLGAALNFLMFFSLTTLSKKATLQSPSVLTVEFQAWQEPKKVEKKPAQPKQKIPQKPKPKKKTVKKPELSIAEPEQAITEPVEVVNEVIEEPIKIAEEYLPTPVPIFEVSSLPRFVHRQALIYPPAMKQQDKEGKVVVEVLVDKLGKVRKVYIIESAGDAFDLAAIRAIEGSTFIPANSNGKPVPVLLRVPISFKLL